MGKVKIILMVLAAVALIVLSIFLFYPLSSENQYFVLSRDFVQVNPNATVVIDAQWVEFREDRSIVFPAEFAQIVKKDSTERTPKDFYYNENGDSVPILQYFKTVEITKILISPSANNQVVIPQNFYQIRGDKITISDHLVRIKPQTVEFYSSNKAKISGRTAATPGDSDFFELTWESFIYGISLGAIGFLIYLFSVNHPRVRWLQLRSKGINVKYYKLGSYKLQEYDIADVIYMLQKYQEHHPLLKFTVPDIKTLYMPKPLTYETRKKTLDEKKTVDKKRKQERDKFEKTMEVFVKAADYKKQIPMQHLLKLAKKGTEIKKMVDDYIDLLKDDREMNFMDFIQSPDTGRFKYVLNQVKDELTKEQLEEILKKLQKKVEIELIAESLLTIKRAGLTPDVDAILKHYLQGGNILELAKAYVSVHNLGLNAEFNHLMRIDLAGNRVFEIVKDAQRPEVFDLKFDDIEAKDHEPMEMYIKATVRIDLTTFVNSAGKDTLKARLREAALSVVGQSKTYKVVMEDPAAITGQMLKLNLDDNTAYKIISIDIDRVIKKPEKQKRTRPVQ